MKFTNIWFILLLIIFSLAANIKDVTASHFMGADISYQCLGNDSFLITLNFYRDCDGISAPASATVNISSPSCGQNLSLTLDQNPCPTPPAGGTPCEVSPLCATDIGSSTCNGGSLPGVQQFVYSNIIQLPAQCTDWIISYDVCCRNDLITNLTTPGSQSLYIEATLNNTTAVCNNSPLFTTLPVPYVCANALTNYNQGAIDLDGDSLVYTLIQPLDGPGVPIPYTNASFNPNNPMNLTGPFVFDSTTGQMTFTPNGPQVGVVTILVEEYRNGVLVGSTMRDIQIVVINQPNCSPPELSGILNEQGGVLITNNTLQVCPGVQVTFDILGTDIDTADNLTMTSNVAIAIPAATFTTAGTGDTVLGTFTWTPSVVDTGVRSFSVTLLDDNCPIPGQSIFSINIIVLNGTSAGPDRYYCKRGGPIELNAVGGNNFTWSPASGLSDSTIRNPLAAPSKTTEYIVTSDLDTICKNMDTIIVYTVPDFQYVLSPVDTICKNSSTIISATPIDTAFEPYTFSWVPIISLSDPTISDPTAFPEETTTYAVTMTSDTGCTVTDSLPVIVAGVGPLVEIIADKNNVCPGETVQLEANIFSLECGPTINGCSAQNPPSIKFLGDAAGSTYFATPFPGQSQDSRYQVLYLASDLNAAGITAGTIIRIQLEVGTKISTGLYEDFTIKMGCTSTGSLTVASGWENVTTTVFGPSTITTALGINNFTFTTPYDWDGLSNIIIEICYDNVGASPGGNDELISRTNLPYTASLRSLTNNSTGCALPTPSFEYQAAPNINFFICNPLNTTYTFKWIPSAGLSANNIANPQAIVNGEVTYTVFVKDSFCDGSDIITLNIDTGYSIKAIGEDLCGADTAQLDVTILGNPPTSDLTCGTNGTSCFTTPVAADIGTSNSFNNSTTTYPSIFGNWFWGARHQFIFRASELNAMGIGTGTINELAFNVAQLNTPSAYDNYSIKMGCTNDNQITTFQSGLQTVYNPRTYNISLGWNTHILDQPFDWDGVSNVIIEVCFNNAGFDDNSPNFYTTTSFTSVVYFRADNSTVCTTNTVTGTSNQRPNTRFTYCTAPPATTVYDWSPGNSLSDSTIANPKAFPDSSTTYNVTVTFVNGCVHYDTVDVGVFQFDPRVEGDTSVCNGETAPLTASGGNIYQWTPITGLSCSNCPTPGATPTRNTKYDVFIADSITGCQATDSVTVDIFELPDIDFSNDTLQCFQDSVELEAGAGFTDYIWNTTENTPSIWVTSPGVYAVTITDANSCQNSDSIRMTENPSPDIDLGSDIAKCEGDSAILNAGSNFAGYIWSNGSTDSLITVMIGDEYSVTVVDTNSCPASDDVMVDFNAYPTVELGPDVTLCQNDELELIAGTSDYDYIWSTTSVDSAITVSQSGNYVVTVSDDIGCATEDSVTVDYFPDTQVNLAEDTFTCSGNNIILDAGSGYTVYLWSTLQSTRTISVNSPGTYQVIVTDVNGCVSSDSTILYDITPTVDIGNDKGICPGESTELNAGSGYASYFWTGGVTDSILTVTFAGIYSVTITDTNGCTASDNAIISNLTLPTVDLGTDDSVCAGTTIDAGEFISYLWNTSDTTQEITIEVSGIYEVEVTDTNGCRNTDAVEITIKGIPLDLADNILCSDQDSVVLLAPDDFISYEWSTGDNTQLITVFEEGTYSLSVEDAEGCEAEDSTTITVEPLFADASANPSFIPEGSTSQLDVIVTNGSDNYIYDWVPPGTLNDPSIQNPVATPLETTIYFVTVTDPETNCSAMDTVEILLETRWAIPTAFTPDGTGLPENEVFGVLSNSAFVVVKDFKVWNRWGELVHDSPESWDGKYKGKEQPVGTYVYYVEIESPNGEIETARGAFSLFR